MTRITGIWGNFQSYMSFGKNGKILGDLEQTTQCLIFYILHKGALGQASSLQFRTTAPPCDTLVQHTYTHTHKCTLPLSAAHMRCVYYCLLLLFTIIKGVRGKPMSSHSLAIPTWDFFFLRRCNGVSWISSKCIQI